MHLNAVYCGNGLKVLSSVTIISSFNTHFCFKLMKPKKTAQRFSVKYQTFNKFLLDLFQILSSAHDFSSGIQNLSQLDRFRSYI